MHGELTIRSLTVGYGAEAVIRGLTAGCPPGRLTCLLGANGAGKTTLLNAISGYLPASGELSINGTSLATLSVRARARYIATVPQVAQELLLLTVRQAVALARYPHLKSRLRLGGGDTAAVGEALRNMELTGLAGRRCITLSGGEWRRVLIAQGLAQGTPVLLLDEPTAFLDPPARRQILHQVRSLAAQRNLTVLAVLHDVDLAREFAEHVLLLRHGQLLASGTPAETLTTELLASLYDCEPQWLTAGGSEP